MAASDARAIPIKNTAFRVTFPILDADGDLVTGAVSLDSEVSIDGGTFADCTNEATEIATSSGMYYLDLTAGEMNGDTIAIIVKTATAGAKTTPIVLYTAARSINDLATLADTDDIQTRLPASLVAGRMDSSVGAMGAGVLTATVIAADAITAAKLAPDVTTELQAGLATAAALTTIGAFIDTEVAAILAAVDTEIAAIKAVTDLLPNAGALTNLDAAISSRATPVQVNAEVVDVIRTDTNVEPVSVPAAAASLQAKIDWLMMLARNKQTLNKDTGLGLVRDAADATTIGTRTDSDDGTSYVKGQWA